MPIRRFIAALGFGVLVAPLLVSCSSSGQGARRKICGVWTGSPASGDRSRWYVNMTEEHEVRVSAWIDYPFDQTARPVSFTALQVSNDCDHGATVMVSDRSVLRVENVIKGAVSGSVLVEVTPRRTGRATVTLVQSGAAPSTVTFIVRRLF